MSLRGRVFFSPEAISCQAGVASSLALRVRYTPLSATILATLPGTTWHRPPGQVCTCKCRCEIKHRRIHYAKFFPGLVIPEASLEHGTQGQGFDQTIDLRADRRWDCLAGWDHSNSHRGIPVRPLHAGWTRIALCLWSDA